MNFESIFLFESIKLIKSKDNYCLYDLQNKKMFNVDVISAYIMSYCNSNTILTMLKSSQIEQNAFYSTIEKLINNNLVGYNYSNCKNSYTNSYSFRDIRFIKVLEIEYSDRIVNLLKNFINIISENIWIESILINLNNSKNIKLLLDFLSTKRIGAIILNDSFNILTKKNIIEYLKRKEVTYILLKNEFKHSKTIKRTKYPKLFIDSTLFYESLVFNTYYNNRIYIGKDGQITQGQNISMSIWHLKDVGSFSEFKSIFYSNKFTKYKNITKNSIVGCKYCIYRHMCIDDRELFDSDIPDSFYSKEKCKVKKVI